MEINKEQFQAWLADPVTAALRQWAREQCEKARETWEQGDLVKDDAFQSSMNNSAVLGACRIFRMIEALDYEETIGSEE